MKLFKNKWTLLVIISIFWVMLIPNPVQKGGILLVIWFAYLLFYFCCTFIYLFNKHEFTLVERIILPIPISICSFLLGYLWIVEPLIELFYEGKTWFLWEIAGRLLANTFQQITVFALIIFFIYLYGLFKELFGYRIKSTIDEMLGQYGW